MPPEDINILKFNWYQKYDKARSIIYADLESSVKKVDGCRNNLEKPFTVKIGKYIPSKYSDVKTT